METGPTATVWLVRVWSAHEGMVRGGIEMFWGPLWSLKAFAFNVLLCFLRYPVAARFRTFAMPSHLRLLFSVDTCLYMMAKRM